MRSMVARRCTTVWNKLTKMTMKYSKFRGILLCYAYKFNFHWYFVSAKSIFCHNNIGLSTWHANRILYRSSAKQSVIHTHNTHTQLRIRIIQHRVPHTKTFDSSTTMSIAISKHTWKPYKKYCPNRGDYNFLASDVVCVRHCGRTVTATR